MFGTKIATIFGCSPGFQRTLEQDPTPYPMDRIAPGLIHLGRPGEAVCLRARIVRWILRGAKKGDKRKKGTSEKRGQSPRFNPGLFRRDAAPEASRRAKPFSVPLPSQGCPTGRPAAGPAELARRRHRDLPMPRTTSQTARQGNDRRKSHRSAPCRRMSGTRTHRRTRPQAHLWQAIPWLGTRDSTARPSTPSVSPRRSLEPAWAGSKGIYRINGLLLTSASQKPNR